MFVLVLHAINQYIGPIQMKNMLYVKVVKIMVFVKYQVLLNVVKVDVEQIAYALSNGLKDINLRLI